MSKLIINDLQVRYDDFVALDGVDLEIASGEIVGLVGESGSGKSTLARAILGLVPVTRGRIRLNGQDVTNRVGRRRHGALRQVQMIFQDPRSALDPRFTAGQCIEEALPDRGLLRSSTRRRRVEELLEEVALDPKVIHARPGTLSGGQQQRVAIARALAADPEVILADEITASLDVSVQAVVLNLLRAIHRSTGLTMLFISHNLAVVRYMADHIAVMRQGQVVEHEATNTLVATPAHPYTQELLAAVPRPGKTLSRTEEADPSVLPVHSGT